MQIEKLNRKITKAHIVFQHNTDFKILQFLKKGFRHCAVILENKKEFILINPLAHTIDIQTINKKDIPDYLLRLTLNGSKIISTRIQKNEPKLSIQFLTCVSIVKQSIGLKKWWIFTPHQLYLYLKKTAPKDCLIT